MSTGTTEAVKQYDDPKAPGYVKPPDGMSYIRVNGKAVIQIDGTPAMRPRKQSKTGGKKKGKKAGLQVAKPQGGFATADAAKSGFQVGVHSKLKDSDFTDILEARRWEQWYYEQLVARCAKECEQLQQLGSTPESREKVQADLKLFKLLEAKYDAYVAAGDMEGAARFAEMMGGSLAKKI